MSSKSKHIHVLCVINMFNISYNLHWKTHIDYVLENSCQRINIMQRLKFTLDWQSLQNIYLSFIRPILENVNIVFDNCTLVENKLAWKIKYEAALGNKWNLTRLCKSCCYLLFCFSSNHYYGKYIFVSWREWKYIQSSSHLYWKVKKFLLIRKGQSL
jgi:hypothetical protein